MKQLFFLFFLLTLISCSQKQEETKEEVKENAKMIVLDKQDFSISYPNNWIVKSDMPKAELLVCSPFDGSNDTFADNFNLMKQDLHSNSIDLMLYDSISKDQIYNALGKDAILESKIENDRSYVLYKGVLDGEQLKWKQLYFVKNEIAYVLTYTAEEKTFDKYSDIAESIFNSFKLK